MARLIERTFDPNRPVVARRFFVGAGRHYNPGDPFDWTRLAVNQRRVKALFDAGKLMHLDDVPAPKPAITSAPTIEQEVQDQEILSTASTMVPDPEPQDELDELNMKELRAIADAEGAPYRVSRDAQREAIRAARASS